MAGCLSRHYRIGVSQLRGRGCEEGPAATRSRGTEGRSALPGIEPLPGNTVSATDARGPETDETAESASLGDGRHAQAAQLWRRSRGRDPARDGVHAERDSAGLGRQPRFPISMDPKSGSSTFQSRPYFFPARWMLTFSARTSCLALISTASGMNGSVRSNSGVVSFPRMLDVPIWTSLFFIWM